jgi:hypothetical protein
MLQQAYGARGLSLSYVWVGKIQVEVSIALQRELRPDPRRVAGLA